VAGIPGNNPTRGIRHYFTYSDDLRFIKGKHSWSMGGWLFEDATEPGWSGIVISGNVAYPTILAFLRDQPSNAILTRNAPALGFRSTEAPGISRMT